MRRLCEKYGWTPSEFFELTMYQALVMNGAFCPEDGTRKLTPEEQQAAMMNPKWKA